MNVYIKSMQIRRKGQGIWGFQCEKPKIDVGRKQEREEIKRRVKSG